MLCIAFDAYAQHDTSSTVVLRGYVVRKLEKQEVIDRAINKKNGIVPIDSHLRDFFMPFGSATFDIATDSLNILNRNRIVFLPSAETNDLIATYCKDKKVQINASPIKYDPAAPYYEIQRKKDEPHLYQFYFTKCKAVKATIPNNLENCHELN
ncbi:MAG: hypothetical protein ACTHJ8_03595, partial [Mucilaginibacter sp.]